MLIIGCILQINAKECTIDKQKAGNSSCPQLIEYRFAVLDGELAVPCNLQPAAAGLNS